MLDIERVIILFEIFLFLKFCVWIKKIKIVQVIKNECKEKRRYACCAFKEKNTDMP